MTLRSCPCCKGQVSSDAPSCPSCGHPFKKADVIGGIRLSDPVHFVGVVLCVLVAAGVALYLNELL
jgi:predicted amidophosphoribosyltransferase